MSQTIILYCKCQSTSHFDRLYPRRKAYRHYRHLLTATAMTLAAVSDREVRSLDISDHLKCCRLKIRFTVVKAYIFKGPICFLQVLLPGDKRPLSTLSRSNMFSSVSDIACSVDDRPWKQQRNRSVSKNKAFQLHH